MFKPLCLRFKEAFFVILLKYGHHIKDHSFFSLVYFIFARNRPRFWRREKQDENRVTRDGDICYLLAFKTFKIKTFINFGNYASKRGFIYVNSFEVLKVLLF